MVARSAAVTAVAAVGCGCVAGAALGPWAAWWLAPTRQFPILLASPSIPWAQALLLDLLWRSALPVAAVAGAATAGALAAGLAQVGMVPVLPAVRWERLDPIAGLGRILGGRGAGDAVKSVLVVLLVAWVATGSIRALAQTLAGVLGTRAQWAVVGHESVRLLGALLALGGAVAVADYLLQRWRVERELRMTRQEMRDELRETEGDPFWRARRRARARALARVRMMRQVEQATVVVTNPTEVACALRYDASTPAPVLVAKGRWHMAERIRTVAARRGVPIVPHPPLARALYSACEVGQMIPPRLYAAVAAVLAWVLRSEEAVP